MERYKCICCGQEKDIADEEPKKQITKADEKKQEDIFGDIKEENTAELSDDKSESDAKEQVDDKKKTRIVTCSKCGYRMYKLPYDRRSVLKNEIVGFVYSFKYDKYKAGDLSFPGKDKDDNRFPGFEKIRGFVCGAEKTEQFYNKLIRSIEQLTEHVQKPFKNTYKVNLSQLESRIEKLDVDLIKALVDLGIDINDLFEVNKSRESIHGAVQVRSNEEDTDDKDSSIIPKVKWPVPVAEYSETPDEELSELAVIILQKLSELAIKIKKFIVVNNIYGNAYKAKTSISFKFSKTKNYIEDLKKVEEQLDKVNKKRYDVDLFSDGSDELKEMLTCLWNAIYAIMHAPILKKEFVFKFENGEELGFDAIGKKYVELAAQRYVKIENLLEVEGYLDKFEEEKLFNLYTKMIKLDSIGFFGVNSANLMEVGESEKQLNALIGLSSIKESISKIKAYSLANKDNDELNIHMCFYGNPGTGKTEVARIIAGILYENKILPSKKVVEVDRGGLVGQFVGETPQKTMDAIQRAMGGVLFIDEAYALVPKDGGKWDYGQEAVATLLKAMEDYRGKFCVILAGYRNEMNQMLASNPGFKSRIQFELDFPNYSREELAQITELMLSKRKYTMDDVALERILQVTDILRKDQDFANAREIRNILDQVIMCQNLRTGGTGDKEIGVADVNKFIQDAKINLPIGTDTTTKKILTGDEELDRLIGLDGVKHMIKKIRAYAKRNHNEPDFNIHMCFTGNPGTGKTEVARILSRILYDAGVLDEAKLVETDSTGLLASAIGETGPKTQEKINSAMGGVLFIDEAYGITNSKDGENRSSGNGDEAVAVLLKEMEDRRGQFCVIMAGYKDEMKAMLDTNPGFESRLQFKIDFPDYTKEELSEIAMQFIKKKKYEITPEALERVLELTDYFRKMPNFANARTLRNILDQVIMNQNLRAEDEEDDYTIILDDVEDYITDENIDFNKANKPRIGFGV